MIKVPEAYNWVYNVPDPPKMITEFLNIYGIEETQGEGDNPIIMEWAQEVGVSKIYRHDSVAWCGLEMAVIAKRAGKELPEGVLWALNWNHFGRRVQDGLFGDVLVFVRQGGGHTGLYIAEDDLAYHVGGGNESDKSNIVRIDKARCVGIRRPIWKVTQPRGVRKFYVDQSGKLIGTGARIDYGDGYNPLSEKES